ncbi:MAG: succinate dehydrogenase [Planctomycetota bacterium]|nr:MAG: succinate dehydrogenase [Planctomycetota bacterium]
MARRSPIVIAGQRVGPGQTRTIDLPVSETYHGEAVVTPVRVVRARRPGPRLLITAAVHGDELNGLGIVRELMFDENLRPSAGTLMCVPVVNMPAVESQSRYVPDRRDLNRSFPGSPAGSMAARIAHTIFHGVVRQADFCVDLHTAAVQRTNYPNVRADLRNPGARRLATAFGCELIVSGKGPEGSLRRCACEAGVPTIILEAGEVWKIEPSVVEIGVRGVRNVMIELGMLQGEPARPVYQTRVEKTTWARATLGGLLWFHVAPGDLVEAGQPLATNSSVFGEGRAVLIAPCDGIVLGMTTLPAVRPGEPVCHIAQPTRSLASIRRALERRGDSLARRLRRDLSTSVHVTEPEA